MFITQCFAIAGGFGLLAVTSCHVGIGMLGMVKVRNSRSVSVENLVLPMRLLYFWLVGLHAVCVSIGKFGAPGIAFMLSTVSHLTRGALPGTLPQDSAAVHSTTGTQPPRRRIPSPEFGRVCVAPRPAAPAAALAVSALQDASAAAAPAIPAAITTTTDIDRTMFDFGPTITGLAAGSPAGLSGSVVLEPPREKAD